ncbi:hypothetical protein [Serratia nematodiphila]|uniref:hypothetical protein n=1 Tax=Serratia nematodiphila TaxID=458197 RepID=UPI0011D72D46|nr:hypothetical protein [Serratia nematodiphila]TXE60096.1 hypothetical protein FOT58_17625 [Serratia nematodiphila]
MKAIIATALMITSFSSLAECWVVSNLNGQTQFAPNYDIQIDKAEGVYHVSINGDKASLTSLNDTYHSGLSYSPTSSISMVGATYGNGVSFVETWTITPDGKAIYTKVKSSHNSPSQLSSFIGDVTGKC